MLPVKYRHANTEFSLKWSIFTPVQVNGFTIPGFNLQMYSVDIQFLLVNKYSKKHQV